MDTPSNMVYCLKAGKLYGIISMGDVHRAKKENKSSVAINTSFTFLHGYEYIKARKIFLENGRINALPIVDEEYKLIGDYSRWDDDFSGYRLGLWNDNRYLDKFLEKYSKVAIVEPNKTITKKMKTIEAWKDFFEAHNIQVEIIHKMIWQMLWMRKIWCSLRMRMNLEG